MAELKPCPFCGSEKVDMTEIAGNHKSKKASATLICRNCKARVKVQAHFTDGLLGAIYEAWNRRV